MGKIEIMRYPSNPKKFMLLHSGSSFDLFNSRTQALQVKKEREKKLEEQSKVERGRGKGK